MSLTMIDWSRDLEAYHPAGGSVPVYLPYGEIDHDGCYTTFDSDTGESRRWKPDGRSVDSMSKARIRNRIAVQKVAAPTPLSSDIATLLRSLARNDRPLADMREDAKRMLAQLPVSETVKRARDIVAKVHIDGGFSGDRADLDADLDAGLLDGEQPMLIALAALENKA